jgi:DNA gyrase/topoisomerase IV subunit B
VSFHCAANFNVRDVSAGKIADNEEITNIKDLRSENNKRYTVDELRRKVMVLADQDVDGSSRG